MSRLATKILSPSEHRMPPPDSFSYKSLSPKVLQYVSIRRPMTDTLNVGFGTCTAVRGRVVRNSDRILQSISSSSVQFITIFNRGSPPPIKIDNLSATCLDRIHRFALYKITDAVFNGTRYFMLCNYAFQKIIPIIILRI